MAQRTFTKLYDNYDDAAHVVGALEAAGIPADDISLVANRTDGADDTTASRTGLTSGDPAEGAETGAGTGATLGTILGGGAGLLAGLGMLAIPGVGPVIAAGWLIATLTGAGVGAAAGGLLGSLTGAGVSEADAHVYAEGVRRGGALVTVRADDGHASQIDAIFNGRTAVDPTARRAEYETAGWNRFDETAPAVAPVPAAIPAVATRAAMPVSTGVASTDDATLKVMEERLVVGKREVEQGGLRVTAKVVETPVQEQVRLHEERVTLDRRPVDRPADAADLAAFQGRTIEATARAEEAVVAKEARVIEEIGLRKEASDRVETVHDTVRRTEVDVQDTLGTTVRTGAQVTGAAVQSTGHSTGHATGTTAAGAAVGGVAASIDKTLNTNVSGANPSADAPDGTAGNPPGTMASRAVDKTLGTNISGANPDHK